MWLSFLYAFNKKTKSLLFIFLLFTVGCENLLENTADKEENEAILYQARIFLSDGRYDEAIAEFAKLPSSVTDSVDVKIEYASAYSGKCGLDFLTLANNINNIGTQDVFQVILNSFFSNSTSNLSHCLTAETMLKSIASSTGVVQSDRGKYLMAFNSLAKIGVILSFRGDTDNNKVPDGGWDPCNVTTGTTAIPNSEVNEVVTAVALFLNNISGLSIGADLLADAQSACAALEAVNPSYNFCNTINTADVTANHRLGARSLVVETTDGIGLNIRAGSTSANVVTCLL